MKKKKKYRKIVFTLDDFELGMLLWPVPFWSLYTQADLVEVNEASGEVATFSLIDIRLHDLYRVR